MDRLPAHSCNRANYGRLHITSSSGSSLRHILVQLSVALIRTLPELFG